MDRFEKYNHNSRVAAYKPRNVSKHKIDLKNNVQKIWIKKSDLMCYVAHTSLKVVSTNSWYFDSDCSKHMTGDKNFLKDYQAISLIHVTFRDGVKGRVLRKGTLDVEGLPRLKNVLHVEGLTANLISISQLCDQNLLMKFTKNTCKVFNDSQECVLEGASLVDNCYKLLQPHTCHKTSLDEIEIWH